MKRLLLIGLLLLVPFFGTSQPAEKACFSVAGGFYEESPVLELFPFYPQHHIRFTTNGNRPTAQSRQYTEPLLLDGSLYSTSDIYTIQVAPADQMFYPDSVRRCIVIRAAVFDENDSCISEVATNSYFIQALGCDTHGLPVMSLCADSLDLFGYVNGIMVPGVWFDPLNPNWTGNYYLRGEEWERRCNWEFYELDNSGVNQQAGLRTHGGNGRRYQQKCWKLYAREEYGKKRFEHHFFENLPNESFKHLILKPFAASWNTAGVNDYLCNQIATCLNVESLASRPALLYLNGEYWGVYFLHERPDEHYLEDHFDVDHEQVNLLAGWSGKVVSGSNVCYDTLYHWMETVDLSEPGAFADLEAALDIDNFIDYVILELFTENTDWPANNVRFWQSPSGRWRWIFYDGDACLMWNTFMAFDNAIDESDSYWPTNAQSTLFFRKMLENSSFRSQFHERFLSLLSTCFDAGNTLLLFDSIRQRLELEIPFQSERFNSPDSVGVWETDMGLAQWFLRKRCETIQPVLEQFMQHVDLQENEVSFRYYPNPSSGLLTLELGTVGSPATQLEIYDLMGRCVGSQQVNLLPGTNTLTVELPGAPGLYFVKIENRVIKVIRK